MIKSNFNKITLTLTTSIVFLSTLSSYYFPQFLGLRLFEFLSLALILKFKFKKINNDTSYLILYITLFIVYSTISVGISFLNNVENFHFPQYLGVIFSLFYIYLFFNFFQDKSNLLVKVVSYTLKIHVFFFLFQFISFYLFGTYIDLIEPITGETQRNIGGIFDGLNSIRPSGLFGEPAAYALSIMGFNFILLIKNRVINTFNFLSIITVLLSLSALGVVYIVLYFIIYIVFINRKIKVLLSLFVITIVSVFLTVKYELLNLIFLVDKLTNFSESNSYKYRIGDSFNDLSNFPLFKQLFGVGLGNLDIKFNKGSTFSMVLIEQGLILGSIFFILIFCLLIKFKVKYYNIFVIFFLMIGTHIFSQIQFWFLIMSICIISNNQFSNNLSNHKHS